jgi:stage II sporulation protein D
MLILLLVGLPVSLGQAAMPVTETVRVAIIKGVEEVRLQGDGLLATDGRGTPLVLEPECIVRRQGDNRLTLAGRTLPRLVISAPGIIRVNGKGYRGVLDLIPQEKGLLVVNELALEEYLAGLINSEISSLWPIEAVKAQAVVARSYAIYQKDVRRSALYHLESTVLDQVYDGADIEDGRAARAVKDTVGEVLTYGGNVIQSFYHSSCGGHTEAAVNVWGMDLPYLQGVDCQYCRTTAAARWEQTLPLKKIETTLKAAGLMAGTLRDIRPGRTNNSGRVIDLTLVTSRGESSLPTVTFRKTMGYGTIKSTSFTLRIKGDEAFFAGFGNGHGVGLCQWGTKQRAVDGFGYREILSYYYPGVRLDRIRY